MADQRDHTDALISMTRRRLLKIAGASTLLLPGMGVAADAGDRTRILSTPGGKKVTEEALVSAARLPNREDGVLRTINQLPSKMQMTSEQTEAALEIVKRVTHEIASGVAALDNVPLPLGSYGRMAQDYTLQLKTELRKKAQEAAKRLLGKPLDERRKLFGDAAEKAIAFYKNTIRATPLIDQKLVKKLAGAAPRRTTAPALLEVVREFPSYVALPKPSVKPAAPMYRYLDFIALGAHCYEETNEVGADEILLGGVNTWPSGAISKIPAYKVSDDFDKGETAFFWKTLAHFDLFDAGRSLFSGGWPKWYGTTLIMAEEDSGGFSMFLENLWAKVGSTVEGALSELAGFWGSVIGWVLDKIIDFLVELFDNPDDYIATQTLTLSLASFDQAYFKTFLSDQLQKPPHASAFVNIAWQAAAQQVKQSGLASPFYPLIFKGDGGRYSVNIYYWVHN